MSRILLGMHFLSDVLAGAVIGTGLGYLGYFAFA
jgi:membrane-associated phospholipid phosphatase